ncbi:hypothetical protein ACFY9F_35980 [Streptomyces sp. NPDC012421]|uniref:hypothetical protein n=1 Tax=Streptomyces sp. NPDC012421 TaxID=3364832 RepID=UPI0036E0B471
MTRAHAIIITLLVAVIAGLATGIVTATLGASNLAAVMAGGGAWFAVATLGTAIAAFLFPPASGQGPPASP